MPRFATMVVSVQQLFESSRASVLGWCLAVGSVSCFDTTTEWSPPTVVPREPEPESYADRVARLPPEWSEEEKVEGLFSSYCGECHGPCRVPAATCDGTHYIDDIDRLVQEAKIVPGSPDESEVIQLMVDGRMPPEGYPDAPRS